jgi:hypothetical protein
LGLKNSTNRQWLAILKKKLDSIMPKRKSDKNQIPSLPTATTNGNAHGVKKERPAIRQIPKSKFIEVSGIKELIEKLFGVA